MRLASRASRLTVQIALLVALLAAATIIMLRPYLTDTERIYEQGRIDEVVNQGPVTVAHVEWKLDSLKAYTTILDKDDEAIDMGGPAGSTIIVATLTVTPREGLFLKDKGFTCEATLRDTHGNTWDSGQPFDYPLPTYCGDDDYPFTMDKPQQIAQVYVVPKSVVPDLAGVTIEDFSDYRRVLITP
ncbi:hypothetical protein [Kribbella sp. NPDC049584]|uniref:hypothetical protein n=1 Tax=Kribbella sp. NPDC049584 TaxID=3154833 RepID=UPI0034446A83